MSEIKLLRVIPSPKPEKKYRAIFKRANGDTFNRDFGAEGMDDYTLTRDKAQRDRYRSRHSKDLKDDTTTPGYLAYYLLWGDSVSLRKNIQDYKRRFGH